MNLTCKYFCAFMCALFCWSTSLSAKVERKTVYLFGFSASFTDSIAYITDIQCLDSAYMETKSNFLMDRVVYSDQLQTYLEGIMDMKNSTCAVFFGTKKKNVQAEYNKIKNRYKKNESVILKTMEGEAFRFQTPRYESVQNVETKGKSKKKR